MAPPPLVDTDEETAVVGDDVLKSNTYEIFFKFPSFTLSIFHWDPRRNRGKRVCGSRFRNYSCWRHRCESVCGRQKCCGGSCWGCGCGGGWTLKPVVYYKYIERVNYAKIKTFQKLRFEQKANRDASILQLVSVLCQGVVGERRAHILILKVIFGSFSLMDPGLVCKMNCQFYWKFKFLKNKSQNESEKRKPKFMLVGVLVEIPWFGVQESE